MIIDNTTRCVSLYGTEVDAFTIFYTGALVGIVGFNLFWLFWNTCVCCRTVVTSNYGGGSSVFSVLSNSSVIQSNGKPHASEHAAGEPQA